MQNNGLNSYITQLTRKLVLQKDIQLHIIWANTLFSSEIKTKIIESVEHIHFPFDIALQNKTNKLHQENKHLVALHY